ncbi:MAG: RNA polymerase sigma-70 factor [Bacteroidales bacterium]|nr:RNA polymerase sigma-70 factor [Bacteroidales bacterium]MBN2748559.1 RNA polymerase sigma-70 factor [Bacteroidales bacterium]
MFGSYISIGEKRLSFREIFTEYYPSLHHFAFKILKNKHDAEDVVQDAFIGIWEKKPSFPNTVSFRAYLYLTVRNKALDVLKKRNPIYLETIPFEPIEQEVNSVVREEAFRLLDEAIEKLPAKTRDVLMLSLKGMSVKEVADELNISVNTVKTLKQRAYKFLKENCAYLLLLIKLVV